MSMYRDKFDTSPNEIYLLSHSVGLTPQALRPYVEKHYFDPWRETPEAVWPTWIQAIEAFRQALANLFNESTANFCPQTNISSATTKVLYSWPELRRRPTVLLSEDAFPSVGYVFQKGAEQGFDVKFIPRSMDSQDPQVWKEHMTDDVGLVLITHVHSNTGELAPVADIVELARTRDVLSIVDTAQSNGVIPIDFKKWNADFVVGSCVKWLCGGPGAGFLWVNPAVTDRAAPIDVGWFSHDDPFEFDIHQFRYASDALRFWGGTPSVLPYVAATPSIATMTEIGVETVHAHNIKLCDRLINAVSDSMLVSPRAADKRGGTVVVNPGERGEQINARLAEAGIKYDQRAEGIRLSPHIYNTDDEVSALVESLS